MKFDLRYGDSREVLPLLGSAHADALVTDPPAGISFMGKKWDHDHGGRVGWVAAFADIFKECLRVLKPGAHGLVWALPRTSHWTATALEDAGFEIRDICHHLFGVGFPKSLNLPGGLGTALKPAVERWILCRKPFANNADTGLSSSRPGSGGESAFARALVETREKLSSLARSVQTVTFSSPEADATALSIVSSWQNCLAALWNTRSTFTTATVARTTIDLRTLNSCLSEITPAAIIRAGISANGEPSPASVAALLFSALRTLCESTSFAPDDASSEARTSGQPFDNHQAAANAGPLAHSANDIILVRKPLDGTVAGNVAAHGTGALNIDACRIGTGGDRAHGGLTLAGSIWGGEGVARDERPSGGRWPANVTLDEEAAALLDAQSGELPGSEPRERTGSRLRQSGFAMTDGGGGYGDSGGASRFFYVAKPDRGERDIGCEDLPGASGGVATDRKDGSAGLNNPRAGAGRSGGARNIHPTVKSVDLMRWLIRLITPRWGLVLDPFMGSGSTGIACAREGMRFIGIERERAYFEIARRRIVGDAPLLNRIGQLPLRGPGKDGEAA